MRAPANGVHWLAQHVMPAMPCIYVAGNHEFYKGGIKEGLEDGRAAAERFPDVHLLENDFVIMDGVRFIGATLWTDFRIDGSQYLSMVHARERMNDYGRQNRMKSMKVQRVVRAASNLEMEYLTQCEIDPTVRYFCEQPFRFSYRGPNERRRRYTPDVLVVRDTGRLEIVEIKYESDAAAPDNDARWPFIGDAARSVCLAFEVITERHLLKKRGAVNDIFRARHSPLPPAPKIRSIVQEIGQASETAREIATRFGLSIDQIKALIRRQYLLYAHGIVALTDDTLLRAGRVQTGDRLVVK